MTSATITFHTAAWATLEVTYPDGTFTITRLDGRDLYERGYDLATFNAKQRGLRLDRYSRAELRILPALRAEPKAVQRP